MAKSHTPKKRNNKLLKRANDLAEQEVAKELALAYVDWWVTQEIKRLISSNVLVIFPDSENETYYICNYKLEKTENHWTVTSTRNSNTLRFSQQASAVFYCLFEHKHYFVKSKEIQVYDNMVLSLESDQRFLKHKYKQARAKQDGFGMDLCDARLSNIMPKLEYAKEHLQKLLNSAKYIKLWDTNNHETNRNRKQGDSQAH